MLKFSFRIFRTSRSVFLFLFWIGLVAQNCVLFQRSAKIKPIGFDYRAISENYFNPQNEKPFPLTIQRGNNLYNSTTQDGNYLFYATDKDGNFDIWFRDLQSSVIVPVTEHPSQEYKPAISPDGKKLVFVSEQYDSEGDLILLRMDPEKWVDSVLKGKRFINQNFQVLTNPDWRDNTRQERVVDTDPAWLPDNQNLVYSTDRFSPGLQNLVLLDTSSGKQTKLTYGGGTSPFVSEDGQNVYFLSYRDSEWGEVYRLDLDSGEEKRITYNNSLDFSPSVSRDNQFLYYTSIREDTNANGVLDERDKSYIVRKDLYTGEEEFLSSGDSSVFDTRYSNFNGGSILFSAAFYNSINVYFIPYSGSIPRKESIREQFNYSLQYESERNQGRYFLALDSVELFFSRDPLFPIFQSRVQAKKVEYLRKYQEKRRAEKLLGRMNSYAGENNYLGIAYSFILDDRKRKMAGNKIRSLLESCSKENTEMQASLLHLLADWQESNGNIPSMITTLESIQKNYPDYHLIREVKNKYGFYEFKSDSVQFPKYYIESIQEYENRMGSEEAIPDGRKGELHDLLQDIHTKVRYGKSPDRILEHIQAIRNHPTYPKDSKILTGFMGFIEAEVYKNKKDLSNSVGILDRLIPIPENLELYPIGQKSIFEIPLYIKMYRNPSLGYIHLLKYRNSRDSGDHRTAKRHLQIYMEFFDPILSPPIDESDLTYLFNYWENKAIEYERLGDLYQASIHYYFNNLGIALAKSKNLSYGNIYENYAVYYQRKMLDTVFQYGRELRKKEEEQLLSRMNVLGEENLDILGNLSKIMGIIQSLPFLDALKYLGDFRDLKNKDVLHENALKLSDLYFNYHLEKNRPFLNLAVAYGHAYYLINRSVINETALYARGGMTEAKKIEILENYKKAEYELRWILFADPTFPDAYQLLGWLYQYIDIIKAKQTSSGEVTEEERYSSAYQRYFPDKNFEENVELYTQILEFLGDDYPNKKVLSDMNLNLGNNYFLLSNYPKANETAGNVEEYGNFIVPRSQFDDYRQEAVFRYNYGRSSLYRGNYSKAIQQFQQALDIYKKKEYYPSLSEFDREGNPFSEENEKYISVKGKMAILNALIGLCYMEMGQYESSVSPLQTAISHNRSAKELDDINLWNSLAISYLKTGRHREASEILEKAEEKYNNEQKKPGRWTLSLGDWFWSLLLPDNIRVMGDGRFPGEFPLHFKGLLSKSIRINNYIQKKEYSKAFLEIEEREEFIRRRKLHKWVMGNMVSQNSNFLKAQIYFDSEDYQNAFLEYKKIAELGYRSGNTFYAQKGMERMFYSAYSLAEFAESTEEWRRALDTLDESRKLLENYKKSEIQICEKTQSWDICRERFVQNHKKYDLLMGLNYFYRGEVEDRLENWNSAFRDYGMALSHLKNPGNVDSSQYLLDRDPYSRRERIRNMLNLARLHLRLGGVREAKRLLKEAEEYSYEFRLEEEQFIAKMIAYELETFFPYQGNARRIGDMNRIVLSMQRQYNSEEILRWNLPKHLQKEYMTLQSVNSFAMGKPEAIPRQRDLHRQNRLSRNLTLSSIEYNDPLFDTKAKSYNQTMYALLSKQKQIESKAVNREPIQDDLKEKLALRKKLRTIRADITKNYPSFSKMYNPNQFSPSVLPANSLYLRCFRSPFSYSYWLHTPKGKKYFTSQEKLSLEEINRNLGMDGISRYFLNPDNCNWLFEESAGLSKPKVQLVTKDSDVHPSKIRQGIPWRWRSVLVPKKSQENRSRLKYIDREKVDVHLLDTDILYVTEPRLEDKKSVFSYKGAGSLSLRELVSRESEISAIVLEGEENRTPDWNAIMDTWDYLGIYRPINLIFTSRLDEQSRLTMKRDLLPKDAVVFGVIPDRNEFTDPVSVYRNMRNKGLEYEKSRNYQIAYNYYYNAGSILTEDNFIESIENEVDLARMKRRLFSNLPPDYFYRSIIREYQDKKLVMRYVYTHFLTDCFSDRTLQKRRAACESYYHNWMESDRESAESIEFYYRMYLGLTKGYDTSLNKALGIGILDNYIKHMQLSDLFLENFLFRESNTLAEKARPYAGNKTELNFISNRRYESGFHRAYVLGETEFTYKKINLGTTYALGYNRDWDSYLKRVNSASFRRLDESDNVFEAYRRRMYHAWRDWEYGEEFESSVLVNDDLFIGGSVMDKLTHSNRSLYFYLVQESSRHQIYNESDILIDQLIHQEEKEGFYNRAFAYAIFYADQLLRNGRVNKAIKYMDYFEKNYDTARDLHPKLESRYAYVKFKLSKYTDKVQSTPELISKIRGENRVLFNLFSSIEKEGINGFSKILNNYVHLRSKKNQPFTVRKRKNVEDLIQYMKKVSLLKDSTDGFLDAVHFEQVLHSYNERTIGKKPLHRDIAVFVPVAKRLIASVPENQEISVVNDFNNQTFLIQVSEGKTKGRVLFSDNRDIKTRLRGFYRAAGEGGSEARLREILADRYRNSLRLNKNRIHYLYLTDYHLDSPFLQNTETELYHIQNLESLLRNNPIPVGSLNWVGMNSSIRKDTRFAPPWFQNLKSIEEWELKRLSQKNGKMVYISQEELRVDESGSLVFGGYPIAQVKGRVKPRFHPWFLSSNLMGFKHYLSDDVNHSLFHLDKVHYGLGVVSVMDQSDFHNAYFMKNYLQEKPTPIHARYRFVEARDAVQKRFPFDRYWTGFRLYTNSFILP